MVLNGQLNPLFADDTALYHSSENSADVVTHLQHTGRRVQQYMDKWKINLNKQKLKPYSSQTDTPGNFLETTSNFSTKTSSGKMKQNIWEWSSTRE